VARRPQYADAFFGRAWRAAGDSIGEADGMAAEQARIDNDERPAHKVRIALGTAGGAARTLPAASQHASQARKPNNCRICGGTGHCQKTCKAAAQR
jgi:hypothetical protein